MTRFVSRLFFAAMIMLAIVLIAPGFINWNAHKAKILAQLEPYLQRKIDVAGDVRFRLIPNPEIMLEQVTIANPDGAKNKNFVEVEQLGITVGFKPLLEGKIEVRDLNFVAPRINLEVLQDGSPGWAGVLEEGERQPTSRLRSAAGNVSLNRVSVSNGSLHYFNQMTGAAWQLEQLDLTIGAETLLGPYRISGAMKYNDETVNIDLSTGKYDAKGFIPVHLGLVPLKKMPSITIDGALSLKTGFDLQAEWALQHGSVASLFMEGFLQDISFMHETANLRGMMNVAGREIAFNDIRGKVGKSGVLTGKVTALFEAGKLPVMTSELQGENLDIAAKGGMMTVPSAFNGHFLLMGKNVTWQGIILPEVSLQADSDQKEWTVKEIRLSGMPGGGSIKLAGVVTPDSAYAAWSMQLSTNNLQKLIQRLKPGEGNVLKYFTSSPVKKMKLSTSVDVKPDRIVFADISATADDAVKIAGTLNLARKDKNPVLTARLDIEGLDAVGWRDFFGNMMKTDADIEINAANSSLGDIRISKMSFKGKINSAGLAVQKLSGNFSEEEHFKLAGMFPSFQPAAIYEVDYELKIAALKNLAAALNIPVLPPWPDDQPVDVKGQWKKDAVQSVFTMDGSFGDREISLKGTSAVDTEGRATYQYTLKQQQQKNTGAFAFFGLPVDDLITEGGKVTMTGNFEGSLDDYALRGIVVKNAGNTITGAIRKQGGKYFADLEAGQVYLDAWRKGKQNAPSDFTLNLKGKLWDGALESVLAFKQAGSSTIKGEIKGANLDAVKDNIGLEGFSAGRGDIAFDLGSEARSLDRVAETLAGDISIRADMVTIARFNLLKLSSMLSQLTAPPLNLVPMLASSLKFHGTSAYHNVKGDFDLKGDKIDIQSLVLPSDTSDINVRGTCDLGEKKYDITAEVQLHQPADMPVFHVRRAGDMKKAPDYNVDAKPLETYIVRKAPSPPVVGVPPPSVKDSGHNPIQGILQRLENEAAPSLEEEILPP